MRLRRIADGIGAGVDHVLEQHALIEARTANEEIVGGPFTALVLSPRFTQPFPIRFKSAGREHTGAGFEALSAAVRCDESAGIEFNCVDRRVVADLHPERFGAAIVGVHKCLPAAHEERVGPRDMQRARKRRLKAHAVLAHPRTASR